jgi:hypothetical protein
MDTVLMAKQPLYEVHCRNSFFIILILESSPSCCLFPACSFDAEQVPSLACADPADSY